MSDIPEFPFRVWRPLGEKNKPEVNYFYYTGEKNNPYRCEQCTTKLQRDRAAARPDVNEDRVRAVFGGAPGCCRKCGVDFYR